ncbi:V-type proton ATPase subunit Vha44 isoform X1 [Haematobia irritans]|uniref:V-type proton ATPase subunit Vha44 isoform X1 n=1 Tax=Haematobia irritans TaxID=7368 RepID=UPI003F50170B
MSEYWLISAPGDKTCQQTFDTMNNLTSKQNNLCNNFKFHIPDLKVGTLDQLVGLSDDLGKLDTYVEQITRKVAAYLGEVLEDQRDKLHENLLANNSPGPPDDDCPTTTTHANTNSTTTHSGLTGKSSNLSNSHETATTTTSCSVCPSGSCLNCSSNDETDRDYDTTSVSPMCHCDFECDEENLASTSLGATSPTTIANDNCTISSSNSTMNLRTISPAAGTSKSRPHRHHFVLPGAFRGIASSSSSTCNIATAITAANSCATGPATANSSYLCSTSAPTSGGGGVSLTTRSLLNRITSSHNNNTCSINNNSTSTTTTTLCSLANKTPPASATIHNSSGSSSRGGFAGFFSGNIHSRSASKPDVNESHHNQQKQEQLLSSTPPQKPQHLQLQQQHNNFSRQQQQNQHHYQNLNHQQQRHHHNHHHQHHHDHNNHLHHHQQDHFDNNESKHLKSSDSLSDVSDTFEWWFQRHKRNSTKKSSSHSSTSQLNINIGFNLTSTHRSSPVSSCCGSSSHGRSSPDTDMGEPPALPLSPG